MISVQFQLPPSLPEVVVQVLVGQFVTNLLIRKFPEKVSYINSLILSVVCSAIPAVAGGADAHGRHHRPRRPNKGVFTISAPEFSL